MLTLVIGSIRNPENLRNYVGKCRGAIVIHENLYSIKRILKQNGIEKNLIFKANIKVFYISTEKLDNAMLQELAIQGKYDLLLDLVVKLRNVVQHVLAIQGKY